MDKEDPRKRKRVSLARKKVKRTPSFDPDEEIVVERKPPTKKPLSKRIHRCKKCDGCNQEDCGDCLTCRDMLKFGGTGKLKQACLHRKCEAPIPPDSQPAITNFFRPPKTKDPKQPEEEPSRDVIPQQPSAESLSKRKSKEQFEEEGSIVIDLSEPGFLFFSFFSFFSFLFFSFLFFSFSFQRSSSYIFFPQKLLLPLSVQNHPL